MNSHGADLPAPGAAPRDDGPLGMWVFLASEILFFGALLLAYGWSRVHFPAGFGLASRHTDALLGTINTALLLTSSAAVAAAAGLAREAGQERIVARLLWGAATLGVLFLAIKGLEYRHEWQEHLFPGAGFALADTPGAEMFFAFYFTATALHALHLAIGIGVLGVLAVGAERRRQWASAGRLEVAGLYWHFVDVVWIVLYPLLYLVNRHP